MPLNIDEKNNYFRCDINKYTLYSRGCTTSMGGVSTVLMYDASNDISFTQDNQQRITSIVTPLPNSFLSLDLFKNSVKYTENFTRNNVGYIFDNTLEISLDIRAYDKRFFLEKVKNKTLIFIIQDANDTWWLLGEESGLILDSFTETTGLQNTDLNGYSIMFKGFSTFQSKEITQAAIDVLFPTVDCSIWSGVRMRPYNLESIRFCTLDLKKLDYLG